MMFLKQFLLSFLRKRGFLVARSDQLERKYQLRSEFNPLEQLFHKYLHDDFFFVQIGANDGVSFDPIHHFVKQENVRGIVLEPLKDLFLELCENYKNYPNILPLNRAIHASAAEMTLYRVDRTKHYPAWTKGTASFQKEHHRLGNIAEEDILEETVPCLSFQALIEQYGINHIDLLQIDTEGYDYEILKMVDFDRMPPGILSFEHGMKAGIMPKEKFFDIQDLLYSKGYNLLILENDAIAYREMPS